MASGNAQFAYSEGTLTWEKESLGDKEIITVWKGSDAEDYTIFSLDDNGPVLRSTKAKHLPARFLDIHQKNLSSHLQHKATILVSTLSGTGLAPAFFDQVLQPLLDGIGIKYNVVRTTSATSVKEFAATLGNSKQTVVALTGDGGTVDILNSISDTALINPNLVLIPLGTANALFHSTFRFSLPPYIQALRTLLHGTPTPLPNFRASFSNAKLYGEPVDNLYGAVVASYGFHATLVAKSDTPEYRKHGSARFGMVAQDMIANPHVYKAKVNGVEGGQYVMATLVSNLESTFIVAAESKPLDGVLWLIHLNEVMEAMKGYQGLIKAEKTEKMKIEMLEEGTCCVDGLIVVVKEGGWMEVEVVESKVNLVA